MLTESHVVDPICLGASVMRTFVRLISRVAAVVAGLVAAAGVYAESHHVPGQP
jgi:hypothetical protein